jgi:ribosomal protein S27AE
MAMAKELKMPPSVMEGPGGITLPTWGDPKEMKVVGKPVPRRCPRCQQTSFLFHSGCWTCRDCGYSKCG